MKRAIIYFLLVTFVCCDQLYFKRNLTCIQSSQSISTQCNKWNQSTSLYYHLDYFRLCFPENTFLQTTQGNKMIKDIEIGDKILSFNHRSNQLEYSDVVAWISRDADALSTFTEIHTERNDKYLLSPLHNIAVKGQTIQYRFAKTLQKEMLLFDGKKQVLRIEQVRTSQQIKGLYAPVTRNSNFYIYPNGYKQRDISKLILVHCFSQIHNPASYQQYITPLLEASTLLIDHNEPHFINPFYYNFKYLLGAAWTDQDKVIKLEMDDYFDKQNNLRTQSYSVQKGGGGGRGGDGGGGRGGRGGRGGTHYVTTGSHSSSSRKKRLLKLFSLMSIMKNTIFNV